MKFALKCIFVLILQIVGLMLTYFLLIYQTRDSKMEMQGFLKAKDFERDLAIILESISRSNDLSIFNQTKL
jgi:hypothetical protein